MPSRDVIGGPVMITNRQRLPDAAPLAAERCQDRCGNSPRSADTAASPGQAMTPGPGMDDFARLRSRAQIKGGLRPRCPKARPQTLEVLDSYPHPNGYERNTGLRQSESAVAHDAGLMACFSNPLGLLSPNRKRYPSRATPWHGATGTVF